MQGKGVVKFFLVLMAVVCLIQYFFHVPTNRVEKEAVAYAENIANNAGVGVNADSLRKEAEKNFLDSMSSEDVFRIPIIGTSYTYQEMKGQQLALGLDLKGGMSTVLQVDLKEFLLSLSNNSSDPAFLQALDNAEDRLKSAQSDYISLFGEEYNKMPEKKPLSRIFGRNATLKDQINTSTSDGEIIRIVRTMANETVDLTYKRLKDRIDKFGVSQPNVTKDQSRDLIFVELPGVSNPERARSLLQATAKLEFWDVYRISDPGIIEAFGNADERLKKLRSGDTAVAEPQIRYDSIPAVDDLGNDIPDSFNLIAVDLENQQTDLGPLLSNLNLNFATAEGTVAYALSVMGQAERNKMNIINSILEREDIKALFPRDLKFLWSRKPAKDYATGEVSKMFQLYAMKKKRGTDKAPLEGDRVVSASENSDPVSNEIVVSLDFDQKGAQIWGDMTTRAFNDNNREIAIVLDNEVVSAPGLLNGPILGGSSQISGNFNMQEAKDLANILQVGKLPAEIRIVQDYIVGPTLGAQNIQKSLKSLTIGFIIVLIFMIIYYGTGGIVSIIALFTNLFFIFGALASIGTVLTLPGIAGIVLTIGMAVDANVIIFERIREELREGKSMLMAVQDGFAHSYSAIIDANVTTILTAIVLAWFGLGPIKGFAVVLIIGVLSSLLTAVLFSRLIVEWWLKSGRSMSFFTTMTKDAFANLKIDWLGLRKYSYVISGGIILIGIFSFFTNGFDLGVDFKGGYSYKIEFSDDVNVELEELRSSVTTVFGGQPVVKAVDVRNEFNVTTSFNIESNEKDASDVVMKKLHEGVSALLGQNIDYDNFKNPDGTGTHVSSSAKVQPTIADDIKKDSVYATIFALLLIFLYIFIRFNKWQYSLGAVAALFHDTLIVLSIFSIFRNILPFSLEIDQAFIAALLTVIGYSINDTVVVFDRIREFFNTYTGKDKKEVINMAVNSTVSRTIITSITTLFVVMILFLFGGSSIKGFAFALVVGIIVGTYSSVFIATPIVMDLTGEIQAKESGKKGKRFSKALK